MVNPEVICSIVDSFLESRKGDMRRQLYATVDTLLEDLMRGVGRQVQQLLIAFQPSESPLSRLSTPTLQHQLLPPQFDVRSPMASSVFAVNSGSSAHNNNYNNSSSGNQTASAAVVATHYGNLLTSNIETLDSIGNGGGSNENVNNNIVKLGNPLEPDKKTGGKDGSSSKVKFFKNRHATVKKEEVVAGGGGSPASRNGSAGRTVTVKVCYNNGSVKETKFFSGKRSRDTLEEEGEEQENTSPIFTTRFTKRAKSDDTDLTAASQSTKSTTMTTPGSKGRQMSKATSTTTATTTTATTTSTKRSTASSTTTTPKRVIQCPQEGCSKVVHRMADYVTHIRRHLSIQPYYCTWTACTYRGYEKFGSLKHVKQTHYRRTTKDGTPEQINQWDPNLYIKVDEALLNAELPAPKGEQQEVIKAKSAKKVVAAVVEKK